MKKASVFRWLLGGLGAVTAIATALSNVETLTVTTGLIAAGSALAAYVMRYFGDVNVHQLPKEWQDILAGLGAAPNSLDQQPANDNVLSVAKVNADAK